LKFQYLCIHFSLDLYILTVLFSSTLSITVSRDNRCNFFFEKGLETYSHINVNHVAIFSASYSPPHISQRRTACSILSRIRSTFFAGNRIRRDRYSYRPYWRTACTRAKPHDLIWAITSRVYRAERHGFPSARPKLSRLRVQHMRSHSRFCDFVRLRERIHFNDVAHTRVTRERIHAISSRHPSVVIRIVACASHCWRRPIRVSNHDRTGLFST